MYVCTPMLPAASPLRSTVKGMAADLLKQFGRILTGTLVPHTRREGAAVPAGIPLLI